MKIGFIGLGNMGGPMAGNLARAGHDVTGFDPAAPCPPGVAAAGAAAAAVAGAGCAITMLPDGGALRSVAAQIVPAMEPGAILLDCSTVDIDSARAVAAQGEAAGLRPLDAPVSGGTTGAQAGTLTFMVGGADAAVEAARPLFEAMGARMVHCGAAGAGQAAKLCNNMILGATMAVTCEAFALADALGLDRAALFNVVSTSSGASWSMTSYCPAPGIGPETPADRGYAPGFAADLMVKDLGLAESAARSRGVTIPVGGRASQLFRDFVEHGGGRGRDFSALLEWIPARSEN